MKTVIVCCGAIGGGYAALLADAGKEVWAMDSRTEHVETMKANGLRQEGSKSCTTNAHNVARARGMNR